MASAIDFGRRTLAVVTGASQGIGRAIAVKLAENLVDGSTILLIARSVNRLDETKHLIEEVNTSTSVVTCSLDLSKPNMNAYENLIDENVKRMGTVVQGIIFHNAGQVGTLDVTTELTNLQTWHNYYDLNLFSPALLNAVFIKKLHEVSDLYVVNITSLCGRQPFANMAMYGSAKAARDLFFRVLAVEEKNVKVLNYSPGPVETNMIEEVISNLKDIDMKNQFLSFKKDGTILIPEQTVEKLFNILKDGNFKSGDVIDYFDEL